ncbi:unnamed protein product [Natator depressus]
MPGLSCNSRAGRETLCAEGEVFRRNLLENRLHNGNRVAVSTLLLLSASVSGEVMTRFRRCRSISNLISYWPSGMLKKNLMLFNIVQAVQKKSGEFDTCLYFETGDERILIFALEPSAFGGHYQSVVELFAEVLEEVNKCLLKEITRVRTYSCRSDSCTTLSCATEDIKESFIVQAQEQRIKLLEISEHLDITQV